MRHGRIGLASRMQRQRQRQHAEDHGQRRHYDGSEPRTTRLDQGFPEWQSGPDVLIGVVDQKDGVLHHQPHQHDETDHRIHIER